VHTMPNVTRNILLAGLISSVAAVGWTSSTAQIQTVVPSIAGVCCQMFPSIQQPQFVSLNDLKSEFEAAGVTVDESMQPPEKATTQTFWNWPSVAVTQTRTLDLHFPEMTQGETVRLQALPGLSVTADGQNPQFIQSVTADGQNPKFVAGEDVFISPESLIEQLRKAKLSMTLEGWHNPTLRIGQTAVTIGTRESPVTGAQWYSGVLMNGVAASGSLKEITFTWNQQLFGITTLGKHVYSMRVNDRPGTVYGLLIPVKDVQSISISPVKRDPNWIEFSLARVNDQGVLQFVDGSAKVIEFVKSFKGISDDLEFLQTNKYDPARLERLGYGSAKRPAKVMLVRLTGRLDTNTTEIVVPAKLRLMGSPR
jgi:hypothetical protein